MSKNEITINIAVSGHGIVETRNLTIPLPEPKPAPIKMGDMFLDTRYNEKHILASVAPKRLCLINLVSGNRFRDQVVVGRSDNVTEDEFKRISGVYDNRWQRI